MSLEDSSFSRSLLLVNDYKLRTDIFTSSAKLIKKIRQLERDHEYFVRWDQLLYQDWYNLTFRKEILALEQLERRHKTLTSFYVHLNHVAKTGDLSLEQAYILLKEEEAQYQSGDEGWKFVIENLRSQRFHNATKTKPLASNASSGAASAPSQESTLEEAKLNFANIFGDDSALSGIKRQARATYHYLNDIDDVMLSRHLDSSSAGFRLFKQSVEISMQAGNWQLLGRLWKIARPQYQRKILKPMPVHFQDFLRQRILETQQMTACENTRREETMKLRSSYRQLAKLLHPDAHGKEMPQGFQEWAAKKWQQVQRAYQDQDGELLKRLELICMAEMGLLNNLTLDEINQCSSVFSEELETLQKKLHSVRKHPAWRFSSRRRYDNLTSRIRRELQQRCLTLEAQVHSLEDFLQGLSHSI